MNLVAILRERAAMHPDRPALVDRWKGKDRSVTFRELQDRVERGTARLQELGLKRGDTILVLHPIAIELYEILLAAFHAGMRVMLVDPGVGKGFISTCCKRVAPDAFFGSWKAQILRYREPQLKAVPLKIRPGAWFPGTVPWQKPLAGAAIAELPDREPALITFTSGSTGVPKAAVRTHGFLIAQHKALSKALDYEDGEVDLVTLPVFVLANLASGLTSVLADFKLGKDGKEGAARVREQCQRHDVTRCAASPHFFDVMLTVPGSLASLKKVYTGGAAVFPDLMRRLTEALPESAITAVFGSTEAEPMTHLDVREYDLAKTVMTSEGYGLCAGHPVEEIELHIIRNQWGTPLKDLEPAAFEAMIQPRGEPGEVVVAGDHVLSGYLDGVGDEETKIHVGGKVWHRTGDAGWIDKQGCLWLLGRCSAKLPPSLVTPPELPAGALDYPFAVEAAVGMRFPHVTTAAIGWKDRRTLIFGCQPPEADKAAEIAREFEKFGIQELIFAGKLPMDRRHHSKIDYPALFAMLEAREAKK
jgi:acyl-CoA synthetase (AMP-forming)/AMP-acid ligase II